MRTLLRERVGHLQRRPMWSRGEEGTEEVLRKVQRSAGCSPKWYGGRLGQRHVG